MQNSNTYSVLVAAGGTGGHVFPAIAIADALKHRLGDVDIHFAGTRDHLEWDVVPRAGYAIHPIWISGFHRKLTLKNFLFPIKLLTALVQSFLIIKKIKPDVVVCCGGYVSGPVGRMATLMGRTLVLQEQNSYPGVTNRILGKKASLIFTAFSEAAEYFPIKKVHLLGNPVRSDIGSGNKLLAAQKYDFSPKRKTILIMGGSGGAAAMNQAMIRNLEYLHNELHLQIIWQCGKRYLGEISTRVDTSRFPDLRLTAFIDSMPDVYAISDLVICRAGAGTIAELLVLGKPSILVPSPHVAGDHQRHNANSVVKNGAAVMIEDQNLENELGRTIASLLLDENKLNDMSERAKALSMPNAANDIADQIINESLRKAS